MDFAPLIYLTTIVSLGVVFFLCLWWEAVCDKASEVFKCLTFLAGALLYREIMSCYVWHMGEMSPGYYATIKHSVWWQSKNAPLAIASLWMAVIFIGRILRTYRSR